MRLLLDESLSSSIARPLSEEGYDVVHVGDLGLLGAADDAVMQAALEQARVLISADTDFGELLALNRHPGRAL